MQRSERELWIRATGPSQGDVSLKFGGVNKKRERAPHTGGGFVWFRGGGGCGFVFQGGGVVQGWFLGRRVFQFGLCRCFYSGKLFSVPTPLASSPPFGACARLHLAAAQAGWPWLEGACTFPAGGVVFQGGGRVRLRITCSVYNSWGPHKKDAPLPGGAHHRSVRSRVPAE